MLKKILYLCIIFSLIGYIFVVPANNKYIVLQSTTSTQNSGLYDYILPIYKEQTGLKVNVVAVGTGQALKNAARCDGDVLIVHAKKRELDFIKNGYGISRSNLMYNNFVIIGPISDPANVAKSNNIIEALKKIEEEKAKFISRGDDSGTHIKERKLWEYAAINPTKFSGQWYLESGSSMGATITLAVSVKAYTITDHATWVAYKNKQNHKILFSGDKRLFNQYGVIVVNPKHCKNVRYEEAVKFKNWLLSDAGKKAISSYKIQDVQLFYPN